MDGRIACVKVVSFCGGLLLVPSLVPVKDASGGESLELYSRLIAQLVGHMPPRLSKPAQELSQALLTVLDRRREQNAALGAVGMEIISSLNVWFEILKDDSITLLDGGLTTLWERYSGLINFKSTKERARARTKATNAASDSQSAQVMMNRTLTKLLDDGVDSDASYEEHDLWKSWQVETTAIFLQ